MLQIAPKERFPIVRKLADPNDSGTYYVRAVLRDSVSGAIISVDGQEYVNLTDQGSGRFSKVIIAPSDAAGMGRFIDITTRVYVDSSYTTPNEVYSDEVETYLVQDRFNQNVLNPNAFLGAGPDIDYKRIQKIISEEVSKMMPHEMIEKEAVERKDECAVILKAIKAIDIPKPEKVDLAPVVKAIMSLPKPEKVNLEPVLEAINSLESRQDEVFSRANRELIDEIREVLNSITNESSEALKPKLDQVSELLNALSKFLAQPKLQLSFGEGLNGKAEFIDAPKIEVDKNGPSRTERVKRLISNK